MGSMEEVEAIKEQVETNEVEEEEDVKQSIGSRLREQRKATAEATTYDLDVAGYNNDLFCRYRLLDGPELDSVTKRVKAEFRDRSDRILAATCDNLIMGCEEFFVRYQGKDVPLREVLGVDLPVKYDTVLAEFLGFSNELPSPPTARSVVMGVFVNRDIAVNFHGAQYFRWMMSSGADVDMGLGEL